MYKINDNINFSFFKAEKKIDMGQIEEVIVQERYN